jgi:hypothetical protein
VLAVLLLPGQLGPDGRVVYRELDVIASPEALITVRKRASDGDVADLSVLEGKGDSHECGLLVNQLVEAARRVLPRPRRQLYLEIDTLEDHVDDLPSATIGQRLSSLRHEMLHARRNASATRAAIRRVVDGRLDLGSDDALFPRDAERAFADTYDTLVRVIEELDVARDLLSSVRDYLQAKIAENQSEIVKKLTVVASLRARADIDHRLLRPELHGRVREGLLDAHRLDRVIIGTTLAQLAFLSLEALAVSIHADWRPVFGPPRPHRHHTSTVRYGAISTRIRSVVASSGAMTCAVDVEAHRRFSSTHPFGELAGRHAVGVPERAATVTQIVGAVAGDPTLRHARSIASRIVPSSRPGNSRRPGVGSSGWNGFEGGRVGVSSLTPRPQRPAT